MLKKRKSHKPTQTSQDIPKATGYSPKPDSKAPLQKTLFSCVTEHGKIKLVHTKSFTPTDYHLWYWKVLCMPLWDKSNQLYHTATNPAVGNSDCPLRIFLAIMAQMLK